VLVSVAAAAADRDGAGPEPVLRIGLRIGVAEARVSCAGRVRIWRAGSGCSGSVFGPEMELRVSGDRGANGQAPRVTLESAAGDPLGRYAEQLVFEPLDPHRPLRIDGRPYRGEILVHAPEGGGVTVVNAVRAEDYLRGVVPLELTASERTPASALEAQAIAARSYALFYLGRRAPLRCDLLDSTEDQVYGGMDGETAAGTRAVLATRGIVAVHRGRPIRANYSSTCGGATEDADRVWRSEGFPYLRRKRDRAGGGGALCRDSPLFRWEVRWPCEQFEAIVLRHLPEEVPESRGVALGRLEDLRGRSRTPSGRVAVLEVRTSGGVFRVFGDRARRVVRAPDGGLLRSSLWGRFGREDREGCTVVLEGGGYGHGVGMCQYGALELGRRGATASAILRHYYRDIELVRWW
jgi:stage II sporulation protein D